MITESHITLHHRFNYITKPSYIILQINGKLYRLTYITHCTVYMCAILLLFVLLAALRFAP